MDVGDSKAASCDAVQVLRGVAVHGIHEVWLSRASKLCPSVVLVRASEVVITDLSSVLIGRFLGRKGCRLRGRMTAVRYQYYSPLGRSSLSVQAVESKLCPSLSLERTNQFCTELCVIPFPIRPARDIFAVEPWLPCKFYPPAAVRYVYGTDERLCD